MEQERLRKGTPVLRYGTALARDVVVVLLAGGVSAWIAVAGDGDGLHVTAWSRLASGYLPYAVIVCLLGATAPTALSTVIRTAGSQLIMVFGYYTWGPMTTFANTPTKAAHYAEQWTLVALTAVPLTGLAAYAAKCLVRRCATARATPPPLPTPTRENQGRAHHRVPATSEDTR